MPRVYSLQSCSMRIHIGNPKPKINPNNGVQICKRFAQSSLLLRPRLPPPLRHHGRGADAQLRTSLAMAGGALLLTSTSLPRLHGKPSERISVPLYSHGPHLQGLPHHAPPGVSFQSPSRRLPSRNSADVIKWDCADVVIPTMHAQVQELSL